MMRPLPNIKTINTCRDFSAIRFESGALTVFGPNHAIERPCHQSLDIRKCSLKQNRGYRSTSSITHIIIDHCVANSVLLPIYQPGLHIHTDWKFGPLMTLNSDGTSGSSLQSHKSAGKSLRSSSNLASKVTS